MARARTLAQVYRHFGEVDAAGTSPLYERVAVALSESGEALRAIEAAPARKRHPTVILAALHDLALAGRAPALAAAYAAVDGDFAGSAAVDTLLRMTDAVVAFLAPPHRRGGRASGGGVSAEGVGVAPAIPTFGDRRASGHSIIGLAVFDQSALRAEAAGRCWSRGRLLAWRAGS